MAPVHFPEFGPGVSWRPLPRYNRHNSSHVCGGVVAGGEQTGKSAQPSFCPAISNVRRDGPQVGKVSLNPDRQPETKAPPAKETPAKKELTTGESKEVKAHASGHQQQCEQIHPVIPLPTLRMQHAVARSPAVLWVPPAAAQPPPALLHPPQVSPRASSPVQARAPRPSTACWVPAQPASSSPLLGYQQRLIQEFPVIQVQHPGSVTSRVQWCTGTHTSQICATSTSPHQASVMAFLPTASVWRCHSPSQGARLPSLRWDGRGNLFGTSVTLEVWPNLSISCPLLSALSLAGSLTEPCPPSRTLLTWLISVGILLTHTAWLWVSVYE